MKKLTYKQRYLSAFFNPMPKLPVDMVTIIKREKDYAVDEHEQVLTYPNKAWRLHYTIPRLQEMTEDELSALRWEFAREWNIIGFLASSETWHVKHGFRLMLGEDMVAWAPSVPMHNRQEFLVWCCWTLLTLHMRP